MSRCRMSVAVVFAAIIASVPLVAASTPQISGTVSGIELCEQALCGEAVFAGGFAGKIDHRKATGVFWTGITHDPLQETDGGVTQITGGTWMIRTKTAVFTGVVQPGGTLTYDLETNTFAVTLTMIVLDGGVGTLQFNGTLDHSVFPPTITGVISQ